MKNQKGFSLIELLIVVVIIGIIAAIAIPNLLASRRSANEGSAISTMRVLHSAQATYASTYGGGNYAGLSFVTNSLTTLGAVGIIDSALASGTKSGYVFSGHGEPRTATSPACHFEQAVPATSSGVTATGTRIFSIATAGVVHAGPYAGADGWSSPCVIAGALTPLAQ